MPAALDFLKPAPAAQRPLRCLPAVRTDFGGIGRELYSAIIQPHFPQPLDADVEEGKSGWAARRGLEGEAAPARTAGPSTLSSVTFAKGNFRADPGHDAPRVASLCPNPRH